MGGKQRFEVVARRGADEIAALRGEQVGDRARVVAPDRFAGKDDRAGVDVAGSQARFLVGGVDQTAERLLVDAFPTGAIRREMDRRQIERVAFGDDEAARQFSPEPAQHQLGKNDLRGCRADVDADAGEGDRVELPERMFFLVVEFVRVVIVIVGKIVHGVLLGIQKDVSMAHQVST